jgi:hypothetical protein
VIETPATDAPVCHVVDLEITIDTEILDGMVRMNVKPIASNPACMLVGDVSVVITESDEGTGEAPRPIAGDPLDIENNPATIRIASAGSELQPTTFLWQNWCGDNTHAQVSASFKDMTTIIWPETLPTCVNPDGVSTLTIAEQ